jgi:DNA-binding NtrC family response regulator
VETNVRIIAATNQNLESRVKDGKFRDDLFHRLNVIRIHLPPLRERREDIPPLVDHFVQLANQKFGKEIRGASNITLNYLLRHDWPGNVRELRNVVNFGVMMAQRDVIWIEDLAWKIEGGRIEPHMGRDDEDLSLDAVERRHVKRVLLITNGNKKRACDLLGISRPTLNRMLKRWDGDAAAEPAEPAEDADESEAASA